MSRKKDTFWFAIASMASAIVSLLFHQNILAIILIILGMILMGVNEE